MFKRMFLISFMVIVIGGLMALPAAAQNDDDSNRNNGTITVTGQGSAVGLPDTAYVEMGAESRNSSIRAAFAESNETVQAIIAALEELGIAREDIRTTGLNIYRDYYGSSPMSMSMDDENNDMYIVNNNVRVVVRDTDLIADVINVAVDAGANQIYGLSFGISDTAELESEARADAIADARVRANELADLTGLTLGSVVRVVEFGGGHFHPMLQGGNMMADGMGSGAIVEPGTMTVGISVEVTFNTSG